MSAEIIFHHYWTSPFSEKVRLVFGMKGLAWRSVEIPSMMPKPDLMPLTGGYRKTPVMQIGADIYCDSQLIIRELERRFPGHAAHGGLPGLAFGIGFWADRLFFQASVPVIFGEIGDAVPEAFRKDREQLSGRPFDTAMMKQAAPLMADQWRAHAAMIEDQLADGRDFLMGDQPSLADAHAHMNVWFLSSFVAPVAERLLAGLPKLSAWYGRVNAIGHGDHTKMDAKAALQVAAGAEPDPGRGAGDEPNGWAAGARVAVSADDYGRDPVTGEIVTADAHEIAIRRTVEGLGEIVVHFPRAGFFVLPA